MELYQIKILFNERRRFQREQQRIVAPPNGPQTFPEWLQPEQTAPVQSFHRRLPQYRPTPLLSLDGLAGRGDVQGVLLKNEAERFGLNAFKALGSSWAIACLLAERLGLPRDEVSFADFLQPANQKRLQDAGITLCTATDGNHGRGVTWAARLLGLPAKIFMPAGAEPERVQAIADLNADVQETGLSYDETVALATAQAAQKGWLLVQDTAWPGYEATPRLIIQGYSTIAAEIMDQLAGQRLPTPTHIFLQAGVGSMAGGMLAFLAQALPSRPQFIILEPRNVACCYLAAQTGNPAAAIDGAQNTIMAGLNCGTPCSLIMPLLQQQADCFMACPDFVAAHGMRLADQAGFIAGESGAVALGIMDLLLGQPQLAAARQKLGINANSVLLGINTEGTMAPRVWQKIVREGEYPLPD